MYNKWLQICIEFMEPTDIINVATGKLSPGFVDVQQALKIGNPYMGSFEKGLSGGFN